MLAGIHCFFTYFNMQLPLAVAHGFPSATGYHNRQLLLDVAC
jgi:hypothetical protein